MLKIDALRRLLLPYIHPTTIPPVHLSTANNHLISTTKKPISTSLHNGIDNTQLYPQRNNRKRRPLSKPPTLTLVSLPVPPHRFLSSASPILDPTIQIPLSKPISKLLIDFRRENPHLVGGERSQPSLYDGGLAVRGMGWATAAAAKALETTLWPIFDIIAVALKNSK